MEVHGRAGTRGRRLRSLRVVVAAALVLAGVGCSGGSDDEPGARRTPAGGTDAPARAPAAVRAWRAGLRPVGEPVVVGSTAVVLVRARGDEIDVAGLDVATGRPRWRQPWTPGDLPTGFGLEPAFARDRSGRPFVVFQMPGRGLDRASGPDAPLVALDPASGDRRVLSPGLDVTSPVEQCDDGHDACFAALTGAGQTPMRADLDAGRLAVDRSGVPDPSLRLGEGGLFTDVAAYGGQQVPQIGMAAHGRVRWREPTADLFGAGYSSDAGWSFRLDRHDGVVTGSLSHEIPAAARARYAAGHVVRLPLSAAQLVSFSTVDGHVLWSDHGLTDCGLGEEVSVPVRCRVRGVAVDRPGRPATYAGLHASVEGYDRATGRPTWSVPLSGAGARAVARGDLAPITARAGSWWVVTTPEGPVRVDLRDGTREPVSPTAALVCRARTTLDYAVAWQGQTRRAGGVLDTVCGPDGSPLDGAPSASGLAAQAVRAPGGVYLLATRDGVSAYRVA